MGSLSSRPSVPTTPQVVYVPQQQVQTQAVSEPSDIDDSAVSASETRKENLLRRNRGRLGTVRTGLSGLLSSSDQGAQRKTLLGE